MHKRTFLTIVLTSVSVAMIHAQQVSGTGTTVMPETDINADHSDAYNATNATTATKTDAPIMQTPVSVQVVPQQVISDQGDTRSGDALNNVSGVVQNNDGYSTADSFTIRGFDDSELVFDDGLRRNEYVTSGLPIDLAGVDRVEVIKGPSSVLYGQAEPGGLVNFISKRPLDNPYFAIEQLFGSYDTYRSTVDATGPLLTDAGLGYRFNLAYDNDGSFRNFIHTRDLFIFPTLEWKPDRDTDVVLEFKYANGTDTLDQGIPFVAPSNPNAYARPANVPIQSNFAEPTLNRAPTTEYAVKLLATHNFNDDWKIDLSYKSEYHSSPVPNAIYYAGDADVAGDLPRIGFTEDFFRQWTHEVDVNLQGKFETWGIQHTAMAGFNFYYQAGHYDGNLYVPATINIYHPVFGQPLLSPLDPALNEFVYNGQTFYGAYIQDQMDLPWNVHLMAGLRYDYSTTFDTGFTGAAQVTDRPPITPRVGLLWQPVKEVSLFGDYVTNYGDTALGAITKNGAALPPESAEQYETGVKTSWLNDKLAATASVYQLTKQHIPTTDPTDPIYTFALGEARSRGLELDVAGEIAPGWKVIGSYSYIDVITTKDNSGDGLLGKRYPGVPFNSESLWTTYTVQAGELKGLTLGAGVIARGGEVDFSNEQIPGYAIANLMASYAWHIGKSTLTAQLNVDNLFDRYYFSSLNTGSAFPGEPRTFMGSLKVEF